MTALRVSPQSKTLVRLSTDIEPPPGLGDDLSSWRAGAPRQRFAWFFASSRSARFAFNSNCRIEGQRLDSAPTALARSARKLAGIGGPPLLGGGWSGVSQCTARQSSPPTSLLSASTYSRWPAWERIALLGHYGLTAALRSSQSASIWFRGEGWCSLLRAASSAHFLASNRPAARISRSPSCK